MLAERTPKRGELARERVEQFGGRTAGCTTGFDRFAEWSRTNYLCLDSLTAVLAVGVILGFMILIHEFGHYAAAKLLGVRVEVFSIGFGKRLFGFRRGDTDYRIAAIPLGGYVKMSGENPMDERSGDPGRVHVASALAPLPHRHRRPGHEHPVRRRPADLRLHGALRVSGGAG